MVENFLHPEAVAELRHFSERLVVNAGHQYVAISNGQLANTPLAELSASPHFRDLMHFLYRRGSGNPPPQQGIHTVLRCLTGISGQAHNYRFHYDTHLVTALAPVLIPDHGKAGHLILARWHRSLRKFYLVSFLDRALVQNLISRHVLRIISQLFPGSFIEVAMVPGNLYIFYGYRIVHGNLPCDVDQIRATALLHFGNPHEQSRLRTLLRPFVPPPADNSKI